MRNVGVVFLDWSAIECPASPIRTAAPAVTPWMRWLT
jgi:hypothetical protein